MDFIDDFYYIGDYVVESACTDHDSDNQSLNPAAKILFNSLCLRKKFNRDYVYSPSTVLEKVNKELDMSEFFRDVYLQESVVKDQNHIYNNNGNEWLQPMESISPVLHSLLICATIKAGDCIGTVKIVVHDKILDPINGLITSFELPMTAISETQAADELEQLHQHFLSEKEKKCECDK